jgi:hypothetical protein
MKRRNAVLLALLVGFALLSWWLALDTPDTPEDPLATPERPPAPPSAAVPSAPIAELQPRAPAPAPAAPAAPDPPPAAAARIPIAPDTRGFIDALQTRFEADPRDSAAGETEIAIRKLYRAPNMPDGLLRTVLCRKSVCKLDLHWSVEHDEAYREVLDYLADDNAKNIATRARDPDKNGTVEVEAYWIRRPLIE